MLHLNCKIIEFYPIFEKETLKAIESWRQFKIQIVIFFLNLYWNDPRFGAKIQTKDL